MVDAALERAAERVRRLAVGYAAPTFGHVPGPDAALLLCAVDHRTGYERAHTVEGRGPFEGSELLWEVALAAGRHEPGLLRAATIRGISAGAVADLFAVDGETVADPERRASLWRDLGDGVCERYECSAERLLESAGGMLGGTAGLVTRLAAFDAYSDPLGKKAFLFAKISERRGWFEVGDPESWEVCADNVLMRLALRSGLVQPGSLPDVRTGTRAALKELAERADVPAPVLDDLLWELGREDPDLLGAGAGDLREPERDPQSAWY